MYRITTVIDLADPCASLNGQQVSNIHLLRSPDGAMFAVITFPNHQAALVPSGRLGLDGAEGMRALESFRRWLKQQDVPLARASLRFVAAGACDEILAARAFAVTGLAEAPPDPGTISRFQEWLASKPITPARGSPRLTA
jgi:hypothetical protein